MRLLVIAVVILSMGKLRRSARALGIVGVVLIMALLWMVREQTVTVKKSAHITVTTYRYSERTRLALLVGAGGIAGPGLGRDVVGVRFDPAPAP